MEGDQACQTVVKKRKGKRDREKERETEGERPGEGPREGDREKDQRAREESCFGFQYSPLYFFFWFL